MKSPNTKSRDVFELRVKVIPKSSKTEIVGWEGQELKIRVRSVPEKGKANELLIQFLAKTFNIAKSQIELASGHTSRHKKLLVKGIGQDTCLQILPKMEEP